MRIQKKTAYKMGIAALHKENKQLMFDYNLHRNGLISFATTSAGKKIEKNNQAIAILTEDMENV